MPLDSVSAALNAAGVALERARRDLRRLDDLSWVLPDADAIRSRSEEVAHAYANWLVWARMVGVAINAAGRAAGNPPAFTEWWDRVGQDEAHLFFRQSRNEALKELADLLTENPLHLDTGRSVAFWAFNRGPFEGQPPVPQCIRYTEWLYDALLAPARELLWDWTRRELDAAAAGVSAEASA